MRMKFFAVFFGLAALLAAAVPAGAQVGPATAAGLSADEAAAARGVMMHALQNGGNRGGCHPLPSGWSTVAATVNFPSSYGGYGEWINNAELLPVGDNLQAFVKSHDPGRFIQPAFGTSSTVHTTLCAPAGYSYWLVVDSGMAKVAIGRVTLLRPGVAYRAALTAPPIGTMPSGSSSTTRTNGGSQMSQTQKEQMLRSMFVDVPSLGMTALEITPSFLDLVNARPDMRSVRGIFIVSVDPNGWAASQGFRRYDVVTSVNGEPFGTIAQFREFVNRFGGALRFSIVRDKQQMVLSGSGSGSAQQSTAGSGGWQPPVTGPGFVPPATPPPGR